MKKEAVYLIFSLILISAIACGGSKKNGTTTPIDEPVINKIVIYRGTYIMNEFDTLKLEIATAPLGLTLKFFDTTLGVEIDKSTIEKNKITWVPLDNKISIDKFHDFSVKVSILSKGESGIKASFDNNRIKTSTVRIKIFNPSVQKITITPNYVIINNNTKKSFNTIAFDKNNNKVDEKLFTWYSSDIKVATQDPIDSTLNASFKGHLDNDDSGSALIYTSFNNINNTVYSEYSTLKVVKQEKAVKEITLSPSSLTILAGTTKQFIAKAYEEEGHLARYLIENATFTWQSSTTDIASIDQNGLAQVNMVEGDAIIQASISSIFDLSNLKVVDSTRVQYVLISPDIETTIEKGQTLKFSATAKNDSFTSPIIENVPFTWYSTDESIAVIDTNGNLTALNNGKVNIYARALGGKESTSTTVNVVSNEPALHYVGLFSDSTFNHPYGVAATKYSNEFFIADTDNNQIKVEDASGVVRYVAGNQKKLPGNNLSVSDVYCTAALFNHPQSIAVDERSTQSREIYIADTFNYQIKKIYYSSQVDDWMVKIIAGTGASGYYVNVNGNFANFGKIEGIVLENISNPNYLYASDSDNHCIYKISLIEPYKVELYAGKGNQISGHENGDRLTKASFKCPTGLAFGRDGSTDVLYVTDTQNNWIRKIVGENVYTIAGAADMSSGYQDGNPGKLNSPEGIVVNPYTNTLYITDTRNHIIRKYNDNKLVTIAGIAEQSGFNGKAETTGDKVLFNFPRGVTLNINSDRIVVADTNNSYLRYITK